MTDRLRERSNIALHSCVQKIVRGRDKDDAHEREGEIPCSRERDHEKESVREKEREMESDRTRAGERSRA